MTNRVPFAHSIDSRARRELALAGEWHPQHWTLARLVFRMQASANKSGCESFKSPMHSQSVLVAHEIERRAVLRKAQVINKTDSYLVESHMDVVLTKKGTRIY
jgi:hypothetical protein